MVSYQITLGSGATPLIAAGLPPVYASWLVVQDNAAASLRMGGSTVGANAGVYIQQTGGSVTGQFNFPRGSCLNNIYLYGTAGNVIDICFEPPE